MARKGVLIGLLVAVLASTAWAFEPFFSDAAGNRLGRVQEGQRVYIAVRDPDKGAAAIDQFQADLVIFDWNTGAYHQGVGQWFRESGIGTGLYFWVDAAGSVTRVMVQIGSRANFAVVPTGQTHVMGAITGARAWAEGAWDYVDENLLGGDPAPAPIGTTPVNTGFAAFPRERLTARVSLQGFDAGPGAVEPALVQGRFENNNTLVLIVADSVDERNVDQDQIKIIDTVGVLGVNPTRIRYGCEPACDNIVVRIEDRDENLNCNEVEYVPFFVIVNPGGWTPANSQINNFCALMLRGGFNPAGVVAPPVPPPPGDLPPPPPLVGPAQELPPPPPPEQVPPPPVVPVVGADLNMPIRWYNIYDQPIAGDGILAGVMSRFIQYPAAWLAPATTMGRVLFFAVETAVDSGVFELNFGNIHELQAALGFGTFPPGTTIAFYYMDPNDPDDMTLVTIEVGDRPHSQVFILDDGDRPIDEVRIGAGRGGFYVRVHDADANVEACCPDRIVVHICSPSNAGDNEFIIIDEISPNSGIFATEAGIALLPVWDAVGGYQLVFDDWAVQAMNEDTIFVRYNSVDYVAADVNVLGDRDANEVPPIMFPPRINPVAPRNQPWDVSFDVVNVFDTQVFDGTAPRMRFLDGRGQPVPAGGIPMGGSLHLEVTDPDQNEHPTMRELISGGWNKDAVAGEQGDAAAARTIYVGAPLAAVSPQDAGEDTAPLWWVEAGDSDRLTPQGVVAAARFLGAMGPVAGNLDLSVSQIPETVKVFIWNAQRGTWERMDLRETAVGSGIFRSTTCVLVADARVPGLWNLGSSPGDTIMAFYQDPSNHADISVISIKVAEGGADGVIPPEVPLDVAFDRATYTPGDTVTITVTDGKYAGLAEIVGVVPVLVLRDASGAELASWTRLPAVPGQPAMFRVTYVLPPRVKPGTITAVYTDPAPLVVPRTDRATATVLPAVLTDVRDVKPDPEVFSVTTTFRADVVPAGAVADRITIRIFDLTGREVDTLTGTNTATLTWTGGNLRDGAYIYVAEVQGPAPARQVWTFRGFVYIKR